jgi:hypothetical protein
MFEEAEVPISIEDVDRPGENEKCFCSATAAAVIALAPLCAGHASEVLPQWRELLPAQRQVPLPPAPGLPPGFGKADSPQALGM